MLPLSLHHVHQKTQFLRVFLGTTVKLEVGFQGALVGTEETVPETTAGVSCHLMIYQVQVKWDSVFLGVGNESIDVVCGENPADLTNQRALTGLCEALKMSYIGGDVLLPRSLGERTRQPLLMHQK